MLWFLHDLPPIPILAAQRRWQRSASLTKTQQYCVVSPIVDAFIVNRDNECFPPSISVTLNPTG
jgi:hypothetical protein